MNEQTIARLAALIILGVTYFGAFAVAIWWTINKNIDTIPPYITLILGTGLSIALNYIGYHQGLYAGTAVSGSVVSALSSTVSTDATGSAKP